MTQELLGRVHRELLDVLNSINQDKIHHDGDDFHELLNDVEKALAEHAMREVQRLGQEIEQEPVAHWSDCSVHSDPAYPKGECDCGGIVAVADYTALSEKYVALSDKYVALKAQRKPLTDEQIDAACKAGKIYRIDFIRAYQAAHGIKENT